MSEKNVLINDKDNIIYPTTKIKNVINIEKYLTGENLIKNSDFSIWTNEKIEGFEPLAFKYDKTSWGYLKLYSPTKLICKISTSVLKDTYTFSGIIHTITNHNKIQLKVVSTDQTGISKSIVSDSIYFTPSEKFELSINIDDCIITHLELLFLDSLENDEFDIEWLKLEAGTISTKYQRPNQEIEKLRLFDKNSDITNKIYGYKVHKNDSEPTERVTYTDTNSLYTPVSVDTSTGSYSTGSWTEFLEYLIKPCILNKDGSVAFYLDRNNQSLTEYGESYTLTDDQNVMVEFKTLYIKRWSDENYNYHQFSFIPRDEFNAPAWTNSNNIIKPNMYLSAYKGHIDSNNCMRSIPNVIPTSCHVAYTIEDLKNAAANNGEGWKSEWSQSLFFRMDILSLIGKTTDHVTLYGKGMHGDSISRTGLTTNSGMFYGRDETGNQIKTLYCESWWGDMMEFIDLYTLSNNTIGVCPSFDTELQVQIKDNITKEGYITDYIVDNFYMFPNTVSESYEGYYNGFVNISDEIDPMEIVVAVIGNDPIGGLYSLDLTTHQYTTSNSYISGRLCYIPT